MKKLLTLTSAIAAVLLVGGIVNASAANWLGTSSPSWNDPLNWDGSSVPDGVGCGITMVGNGSTTFTATITNNVAGKPVEIVIGGWYSTGRVDHQAGTLSTENLGWPPGWVLIGYGPEGNATYNLADTITTGGTLTGYGTGSGTLNIRDGLFMGEPGGGDGNGIATLNVNTTGALNMNYDLNLGVSGWNATMNLDAGAIYSTNGNVNIPAGVNNNTTSTTSGNLNQAGGSVDCRRINVGSSDSSYPNLVGTVNLNGGTMTTHGPDFWDGGVRIGANGGTGTFNLNGGTLTTLHVLHEGTSGTSIFNFNGGTLKATASYNVPWGAFFGGDPNYLADGRSLTAAYVQAGGAIIDTAGFDNYIGQALLTGTNITDGGLTKNGSGQLEIGAANTFTGPVVVNGGTLYANIGGAPNNRDFSFTSGITVNSNATLRASANSLFGWDGSQAKPITVNVGGTATAENGDQNIGLVTLAGGTLASVNPDSFWGSWHFGRASDKNLLVTSNSTASAGHVAFTAGATIEVASGMTLNFTGFIGDGGGDGPTTVIKEGAGTLLLAGANTYTGNTTINVGTLALGAGGSVNSTTITVNGSTTFDVSAISYTLPAGKTLAGNGSVAGNVATAGSTSVILPGVGGVGTLTFNTNLDLSSGAALTFDLSTTAASGNDQIVVGHNLTLSGSDNIHISALNGASDLDQTADYVLFSVAGTTTMATSPTLAWDGTTPGNYLNYSIRKVGQNVVLHYSIGTAPSVIAASATPTSVPRNQAVTISATVTPGSGSVASVTVNATSIGGSAAASLIQDASQLPTLVYTNTLIVGASTPAGSPALTVVAADNSSPTPLTGSFSFTMDVPAGSLTWDGSAANDNWSSNLNWTGGFAPGYVGDTVTFAGINRLTPNLDTNYGVTGVVFDSTAGSFIIGTANSSALTIGSGGIVNNSASTQTLNVSLTLVSNLTFSAASGNLALVKNIASGGKLITVNGVANTVFGGVVSGNGSLFKQDSGSLTISSNSAWSGFGASSVGFSGPLIAQAGTVTFKNASTNSVSGELVIGGVVTDGGDGNNAKLVVDGATLNVSSWFSVGRGNGIGGVSSDLVLTNNARVTSQNFSAGYNGNNSANMPKGSVTLNNVSSLTVSNGNMNFAESAGSDMSMNVNDTATVSVSGWMGVGMNDSGHGVVNVNGGSVSVGSMDIGSGNSSSATAQGTVTVNSGTLSSDGDVKLGADGSSGDLGKLVVNGGTVNIASTVKRWLYLGQSDNANAEIDVNGGNLHINANTDIRFATGNATGINTFNLNSGAVTFYSDNATTIGGSGVLDLLQGTGAGVQNTFNLNGGTLTVPRILAANSAATSTFNFGGGTLAAAASGTNFMQGLTAAYVMSAGATINSAGHNITIAQPLLDGGGNGGLTKTGNGTLTLNGVNTYTGGTAVNAGTLAGTGTIAGALTNSATLSPGDGGIGALTVNGNITLKAGSTNVFDVDGSTLANDQIVAGANVVYGGVLKIVPTGALTTGQTFTLFSGAGAVNPGHFTSVVSAQPSATFSFTNGVLTVVSAGPSGPAALTNSFSSGTLSLAWPAGQGWRLQMQTNSLTTGLGTNWIYLTDGSVSSTNITVDATKPTVFYRLTYP